MKYVIFLRNNLLYIPVIIPEHASHSEVKLEDGGVPDSAGFFHMDKGVPIISDRNSVSLGLSPKKGRDGLLLECLLRGYGTNYFLKENYTRFETT